MIKRDTQNIRIEIAPKTIFLILGVALAIILIFLLSKIFFMVFISFIIASAFSGPIKSLTNRKVPKILAISGVYLAVLLFVIVLLSLLSVPFAKQTVTFFENLPANTERVVNYLNDFGFGLGLESNLFETDLIRQGLEQAREYVTQNFDNIISAGAQGITGILNVTVQIFGGVFTVISIITIAIYMSFDHEGIENSIVRYIPDKKLRPKIKKLILDIETKLGSWLRGQLVVALISGFLTWVALTLLGLPYAVPLACFTAIMTNVPIFGATLSAVPAIIVALAGGNIFQIIGVPVAYIIIQQIENNLVVPRVMSGAIGIRPIVIILAILIGAELYGFAGVLLAVPIVGIIHLVWDFYEDQKDGKGKPRIDRKNTKT